MANSSAEPASPNLRYTRDHEWVRLEEDGTVTVGITDHAQEALGEIVFVELPEPGHAVVQAESCAIVESVKAASDVYAPLGGTITEINDTLPDDPTLINHDAAGEAWLFRMELDDDADFESLLDDESYAALLDTL